MVTLSRPGARRVSTTSLKIPAAVKRRAAAIARQRGITPHAFMVDAIGKAADAAEQREALIRQAKAARRHALRTNEGFDAAQVHAYLERRIASAKATRPKARSWRA
jgi:hypothetical protein